MRSALIVSIEKEMESNNGNDQEFQGGRGMVFQTVRSLREFAPDESPEPPCVGVNMILLSKQEFFGGIRLMLIDRRFREQFDAVAWTVERADLAARDRVIFRLTLWFVWGGQEDEIIERLHPGVELIVEHVNRLNTCGNVLQGNTTAVSCVE